MNTLLPDEYERRRIFCDDIIKRMNTFEHIEIARILRKHDVKFSENRSGILFDLTLLSQDVFDELVKSHEFIQQSNIELNRRIITQE